MVRKQNEKVARNGLLHGRIAFGFRGGKVLKVIKDLKDFSLLFYLVVVVGDTLRADLFDDVVQVLYFCF